MCTGPGLLTVTGTKPQNSKREGTDTDSAVHTEERKVLPHIERQKQENRRTGIGGTVAMDIVGKKKTQKAISTARSSLIKHLHDDTIYCFYFPPFAVLFFLFSFSNLFIFLLFFLHGFLLRNSTYVTAYG